MSFPITMVPCYFEIGEVFSYAGQCVSFGRAIPYHPLRDILRQACGAAEGDDAAASVAAVQRRLRDMAIIAAEDVALVLQVLDLPVAPEALASLHIQVRKARTFALLRQLIFHAAQQRPLMLTVENLHWCGATLEEWLASLVERLTGAALLLLVTYRPGYQPPWGAHSAATQLAIPPLRPQDSWTVVQAILRRTPPPETSLQDIVAKAGGNPFFLEELGWHAMGSGSPPTLVAVPETIHAVLAARIDRLAPEAKHLLQTAAVLGNTISVPILRAMAELSEDALQRGLAHLPAVEFLYEARAVPELTYAFKHALVQEVAYGSLLQERRRALHARIVTALETLHADRLGEQVEQLAEHAFRGELWGKALAYCRQAGTKAFTHSAHRLLSVHPHAWLLLCLAQVGAFAEGRQLAVDAVRIAEAGHSPYGLAMAYQGAGLLALRQGHFDEAIAVLERGLDLCRSRNLESWFYGLAAALGYAYALSAHLAEALPLLEQVVAQDTTLRGGQPLSTRVIWHGEAYLLAGRMHEAKLLALQALNLVRTRKERGHEAWTLRLLGEIAAQHEPLDAEQAQTSYRQALGLAKTLGMCPLQAHCHAGLGMFYAKDSQQNNFYIL